MADTAPAHGPAWSLNLKQITNCALCPNMCRFACPVTQVVRSEAVTPSGKARLAYAMASGHLAPSAEAYSYSFQCLLCGACREHCPFPELDLAEELEVLRGQAAEAGLVPESARTIVARLNRDGELFKAGDEALVEKPARPRDPLEVLYFRGCATRAHHPEVEKAVASLLDAAGVRWTTLAVEECCGFPAACLGAHQDAGKMASRTAAAINASDARLLVTGCPECYDGFARNYPEHGLALKMEVRHVSVFLHDLMATGRLQLGGKSNDDIAPVTSASSAGLPGSIVYHDPCVLARRSRIIDEPRKLLGFLMDSAGGKVFEPRHRARETACCGAGGLYHLTHHELARRIAATRASELEQTGAEAIATACPFCQDWLAETSRIPVFDLAQLTAMAAGLVPGSRPTAAGR